MWFSNAIAPGIREIRCIISSEGLRKRMNSGTTSLRYSVKPWWIIRILGSPMMSSTLIYGRCSVWKYLRMILFSSLFRFDSRIYAWFVKQVNSIKKSTNSSFVNSLPVILSRVANIFCQITKSSSKMKSINITKGIVWTNKNTEELEEGMTVWIWENKIL